MKTYIVKYSTENSEEVFDSLWINKDGMLERTEELYKSLEKEHDEFEVWYETEELEEKLKVNKN